MSWAGISEVGVVVVCSNALGTDGLFRQSWSGTGTGNGNLTGIMLGNSHCNGNGTWTGNLRACLRVLNKDPNNPRGFVYIMLANDVTLV